MSTTEQTAMGSRVGRARLAPGQLWQVPVFVGGLLAFLTVAASAPMRHPFEWWQFDAAVADLRQGLQSNQEPSKLVSVAETVLLQVHRFGERAAEVHFLAGSAYYRQALTSSPVQAREIWPRVIEHLEEAIQVGADERDMAALQYRLGRALIAQGRDVPRALELMARSIEKGAEQPLAGYQLLQDAYLKLPTPDVDGAIEASRRAIELTDDREVDVRAKARLAHVDLLLRKELRAEAIKELERIGAKVSPPLRNKARLQQVGLCEQEGMWSKALAVWQNLLVDAAQVPGGPARVHYAIGWCSLQLETPDFARATQAWEAALKLGGPEGQAAGLRLGGLRLFGPSPDAQRGLEDWRQALAGLQSPADYRNPYLELADARALFDQALAMFHDRQNYEKMQTAAVIYRKLARAGQADEKFAQAAEAQARKLQAEANPPIEEVRVHYLRAAEAYEQAARSWTGKQGFDGLWHSVNCYLPAQAADRAAAVLTELDGLDQQDARLGEGWFLLAEAQRAAGQMIRARPAYLRSMQYADTPFAARARYQLALEAADRNNWTEAEDILKPNLDSVGVERAAHEKSLYQMAWIQLGKQNLNRAVFYLNDATGRYPNNPMALLVRSRLAECYRQLADQAYQQEIHERDAFSKETDERKYEIQELVRRHQEKRRELLREAGKAYQALAVDLRDRERHRPLSDLEGVLARRAVLGMAECHHDLGEYIEALRLYQGLVLRNREKIETLIACERIMQLRDLAMKVGDLLSVEGLREVGAAARESLPLVQGDLAKMDPAAPEFQGDGVWSWQRWQQWLVAEQKRLGTAPGSGGNGPVIQ